jgi:hypothetical protein
VNVKKKKSIVNIQGKGEYNSESLIMALMYFGRRKMMSQLIIKGNRIVLAKNNFA